MKWKLCNKIYRYSDLMFYGLYWDNVILTQIPMIETSSPEIDNLIKWNILFSMLRLR
jgi:hypothetical protein